MENHTYKLQPLFSAWHSQDQLSCYPKSSADQGHNVILVPVYWPVFCVWIGFITAIQLLLGATVLLWALSRKGAAKNHRYTQIFLLVCHAEWVKGKKKLPQGGMEFSMKQPKISIWALVQASCAPHLHILFRQTGRTVWETWQSLGKSQELKKKKPTKNSIKGWGKRWTTSCGLV